MRKIYCYSGLSNLRFYSNWIFRLMIRCVVVFVFACISLNTFTPSKAYGLDPKLTPLGGERAGNAEGTIPVWEGGITTPPSNYIPGAHLPDPYFEDKVLFTIDASNVDQYRGKLSMGHQYMLENYSTFKLNIYPTRRSASAPQYIYDATDSLNGSATLEDNGNGVANAAIGIPFPVPENALEILWNHVLRYRGQSLLTDWDNAIVSSQGNVTMARDEMKLLFNYSLPHMTPSKLNNLMIFYKRKVVGGAYNGFMALVHETINQKSDPRRAWIYDPSVGRVRRAPNLAYDYEYPHLEELRTIDQLDMFNGAPDRYNWKVVGKREVYVPYNSYKLHSDHLKYSEILTPKHLNPDYMRYELHRAWVVEGYLKPEASHLFKRRVLYIDEDSWSILLADIYDEENILWRFQEGHPINYYNASVFLTTAEVYFNLESQRYLASSLTNETLAPIFNTPLSPKEFTPAKLRGGGN